MWGLISEEEEEVRRKYACPQADAENFKMEVDGIDHVGGFFSAVFVGFYRYIIREMSRLRRESNAFFKAAVRLNGCATLREIAKVSLHSKQ